MPVQFSFSATLPVVVVDATSGAAQTLDVAISQGRTAAELRLALTADQAAALAAGGGVLYVAQADIGAAAEALAQLALVTGAGGGGGKVGG